MKVQSQKIFEYLYIRKYRQKVGWFYRSREKKTPCRSAISRNIWMELCHLTWFLVQNLILLSVFSKSLLVWTFKTKFAWKLSEVAITVSQAGRTAIDKGKRLRLTSLKSIKCPESISHQLPYGVILNLPCRSLSNLLYILHKRCNLDVIGIAMYNDHPHLHFSSHLTKE